MNLRYRALLGAVALAIIAAPAYAQQSSTVTQADVQRLQDNVYLADRDLSQLRSRDATRATQLGTELDDLRDEVTYLKVKLRKERTLTRVEYSDVRDRLDDLRSRAHSDAAGAYSSAGSSGRSTTGSGVSRGTQSPTGSSSGASTGSAATRGTT